METKQTNLCVAADLTSSKEILEYADKVGPFICILKIHVDIIADFNDRFINQLRTLADKHNFLLCEDRKFADIGTIAQAQYAGGIYKIVEWADIIIAHAISGKSCIGALAEIGIPRQKGILLIAQLSTTDHLIDEKYTQSVKNIAQSYPEFVIGFIAQKNCADDHFLQVTPGISNTNSTRAQGQHYTSIETAIAQNNTDIIIVGRDIYLAENPQEIAAQYQKLAWQTYTKI